MTIREAQEAAAALAKAVAEIPTKTPHDTYARCDAIAALWEAARALSDFYRAQADVRALEGTFEIMGLAPDHPMCAAELARYFGPRKS